MKGLTTLIAGGVSMLGVLAADARAYDPEGGYYKKCNESYGRVSGFWTTKPTGCKLARRVLDKVDGERWSLDRPPAPRPARPEAGVLAVPERLIAGIAALAF